MTSELALHRAGECDHGCTFCDEATALTAELTKLYISSTYRSGGGWQARTAREDRISDVCDKLRAIGEDDAISQAARDADTALEAARDAAAERW